MYFSVLSPAQHKTNVKNVLFIRLCDVNASPTELVLAAMRDPPPAARTLRHVQRLLPVEQCVVPMGPTRLDALEKSLDTVMRRYVLELAKRSWLRRAFADTLQRRQSPCATAVS